MKPTQHDLSEAMPEPTIRGAHARAWLIDLALVRKARGNNPGDDAAVARWIVETPSAHPFWHSYVITLIHLRPMSAGREPIIYQPGATHEMWVEALDAATPRAQIFEGGSIVKLSPMNFAAQIIEPTDEIAGERVRKAVQMICDGKLSPDTDFIQQWVALFGSSMLRR